MASLFTKTLKAEIFIEKYELIFNLMATKHLKKVGTGSTIGQKKYMEKNQLEEHY